MMNDDVITVYCPIQKQSTYTVHFLYIRDVVFLQTEYLEGESDCDAGTVMVFCFGGSFSSDGT